MSEFRRAVVTVQGKRSGILCETEDGYSFQYDENYCRDNLPAVSLTLPLNTMPYTSPILFPFFDGLIPEGWLLDIVVHNWKLDPGDRFGLLLASCRDCIGDVSIDAEVENAL